MTNTVTKLLDLIGIKEVAKFHVAGWMDNVLYAQIRKVISQNGVLSHTDKKSDRKKILFFTVQGRPNMLAVLQGILAHSLNLRDAYSEMVICDKILPVCDLPFIVNDSKILCKGCSLAAPKLYDAFNLPYYSFGEFISQQQIKQAEELVNTIKFEDYFSFKYLDIDVGKHVYASVLRYLLRGTVENDKFTREICRRYMISAIMMAEISKEIISRLKPDTVVMHHGIYCTTGIFAEYAKKQGVHIVIFTPAYRKNTYLFTHNETYHKTLQDETAGNWGQLSLSDEHNKDLDEYLNSRRWGSQDFVTYHPNPLENKEKIIKLLGLDESKKTIGLFTNLSWDGQVVFHNTAFENMTEWIMETISYFIKRPDLQLIVRIHPAEVKGAVETQHKLYPQILQKFTCLPGNIKIIDSQSDISTYTLSNLVDAAIVYTTKVGLEFAIKGVPVIVAGEAFYRGKGFTYDTNSKSEYFGLLNNLASLKKNQPQLIAKARQYAYYYFFRRFIPVDFTNNRTWNNVSTLKIKSLNELLPGRNKYLDLICSGILEKGPFVIDQL